jgi:hypothetical protein
MAPGKWQHRWMYSAFANCCVDHRRRGKVKIYSEN